MNQTDKDPLLFQFFTEIGIIEQLARTKLESVLPDNMKISHFSVLNHLSRSDGDWSPARLASALQVTRAAITNTLQRLVSRGLVIIKPDTHDARGKRVYLTAKGENTRKQCIDNVMPVMIDMQKHLGEKGFSSSLPFLQMVREYLDENRDRT